MLTNADINRLAVSYALGHPLPVCAGCPSGQFEKQCETWVAGLARMVTALSGMQWSPSVPFPGRYAIECGTVVNTERSCVVAEVVLDKFYAKTLAIVPAPPVDAPDRIGELLEKVDHLQKMLVTRHADLTDLTKRALILINHYGRAAYSVKVGPFTFSIERAARDLPPTPAQLERMPMAAQQGPTLRDWALRMDPEQKTAKVLEAFDQHTRDQMVSDIVRDLDRPADQSIKVDPRD